MSVSSRISVILPSFNDPRILTAISSVVDFDDIGCTRILVVDGGSRGELLATINGAVRKQDLVLTESDKGIFDALNKGLSLVSTEFVAWLGSDDFISPDIKASRLLSMLNETDILVANTAHFRGRTVTRMTYSWPVKFGLYRFGLNNPHFSTFGRSSFFKRVRFPLDSPVADIDYFLAIFALNPRVSVISETTTYMAEGGFSNASSSTAVRNLIYCWSIYARYFGVLSATISMPIRASYKVGSRLFHWGRALLRLESSRIPFIAGRGRGEGARS